MTTAALDFSAISTPVTCSMRSDCRRVVSHVDSKGWFFCAGCAEARRAWKSCRKLRPAEVKRLGCAVFELSFLVKVRGECGCSIMATLDSAIGQAECYLGSAPGRVVDISETRSCGHCHGQRGPKPCPFCKGVEPADVRIRTFSQPPREEPPTPGVEQPMTDPTTPARSSSLVRWESIHVHTVNGDGALRRPWRAVEEITTAAEAARELRALRLLAEFRDTGACEAWLVDPNDYEDSDSDRRSCEDVDLSQEGPEREGVDWTGLDEAIDRLVAPYQVFAPRGDEPLASGTFDEACAGAEALLADDPDAEFHVRRRPGIGPWAGRDCRVMFGPATDGPPVY